MKMKCLGVVPGITDLFVPKHNLWIEIKRVNGKLSKEQKPMLEYLESICHKVIVAYGYEDGKNKFNNMFT